MFKRLLPYFKYLKPVKIKFLLGIAFGIVYLISIPIGILIYSKLNKKNSEKISEENHEDIL